MDFAILAPQIATGGLILCLLLLGGALICAAVIKQWKRNRAHASLENFYNRNTQRDLENNKISIHQGFRSSDVISELRRKSSGDNTATTDSLLTESDNSSKTRTSSSNSSSSLNSSKIDPMSETLIPTSFNTQR